ncbi:unnamed protein product [Linum tenue]|uniref:At1g61320/AtMIF1 LRR domain-containing protein n=1 Tax=Linum tenue TaxID=586396 RepID=A0AAV0NI16_9ROSI|nr:unnamed protein product [Linum tenue]
MGPLGVCSGGIAKPPRRSDSEDLFRRLPDEIVLDILSRLGTVNETARCGSLGKRWRGICRLIDGGVLDFDKSLDLLRSTIPKTPTLEISKEAQLRFANAVNQALSWHRSETLDALRIAFDLYGLGEEAWKWIEFGLKKRVKELRLLSCFSYSGDHRIPLPLLTPEFLGTQDLSRLEVLELEGLSIITQETVDYIFSHCHSLKRWVLRNSCFRGEVVRVSNVEKLQYLEFTRLYFARRIELMSAPNLHTVKFTGNATICFGDQLPQLLEASFCGALKASDYSLPWPPSQFCRYAPRLERLTLELRMSNFFNASRGRLDWLTFENLRVLDLVMYSSSSSFLACTMPLRAAPMLRELSIWFSIPDYLKKAWEPSDLSAGSTWWEHHSLEVLKLYGVHQTSKLDEPRFRRPGRESHDARVLCLEASMSD